MREGSRTFYLCVNNVLKTANTIAALCCVDLGLRKVVQLWCWPYFVIKKSGEELRVLNDGDYR